MENSCKGMNLVLDSKLHLESSVNSQEYDQTNDRLNEIEEINKKHQEKVKMWSNQMKMKVKRAEIYRRVIKEYCYDSEEFID